MISADTNAGNIHLKEFYNDIPLGKKRIRGRFAIPSGVRCASPAVIEKYFEIESVGIITTKSVSARPKVGYREPIYVKYGENSYINAVGLENPGAEVFREQLSKIVIPENKFLLVSLCGEDVEQFYEAAKILYDYADGYELNFSCPHSKGFGLQVGSDPELVGAITKKISESFDIPVFAKLSPTIPNYVQTAKVAVENGAAGITAINTVGPNIEYIAGKPILSNKEGGLSGAGVRPMGLKAVKEIRQMIGPEPLILGLGGIYNANDIESFYTAGADFFAIGSALTNQNTEQAKEYFASLEDDLINDRPDASYTLNPVDNMDYRKCRIEGKVLLKEDLYKIRLSKWTGYENCADTAGKFYFIMISEKGEKPFSLFVYEDRSFIIRRVGAFTSALTDLEVGDTVYVRGPYGNGVPDYEGRVINLIGGGTGISPVYEIGKKYAAKNKVRFFFGGKDKDDLFSMEKYEEIGEVITATEDGSCGTKGFVSEAMKNYAFSDAEENVFINVGPRPMIESVYELEKAYASDQDIWASIEYRTCCGVGICGKCATEKGQLSCIDGPFLRIREAFSIGEKAGGCTCGK